MPRIRTVPHRVMDHIVFLCQECRGDLEPAWVRGAELKVWECVSCRCRWVYAAAGWERVTQ